MVSCILVKSGLYSGAASMALIACTYTWSQPAPRGSGIRLVVDRFPGSCGPPEHHLRSIKRFKRRR